MRRTWESPRVGAALLAVAIGLGGCGGDGSAGPAGSTGGVATGPGVNGATMQPGTTAGDASLPPTMTGATPSELTEGAGLYVQHCSACHGDDGMGTQFGIALSRDLGLDALIAKIDQTMPAGDPGACTGECARVVGLYVQESFVLGEAPTASACDGEQPGPRQLRLLTRREYTRTVQDLLGVQPPDIASLPVEPRVVGFDNNARASVVTSRHADGYMDLAGELAERTLRDNRGMIGCDQGCEDDFLRRVGKRAFRRPLTDDELGRYRALFDAKLTGGSFDEGVKLALTAMLVSPHFLYRSEVGKASGQGATTLSPYEVASALSYLFLGSMPDQALFDAADQGQLSTKAQIAEQARRLLGTERAREQLHDFATQWLRTDGLMGANKDRDLYPSFTDQVRESLMREQDRFVEHLFFDTPGRFSDLFEADYVFVNSHLAGFYGVGDPGTGDALDSVPAPDGRGGLLGLGSVMAAHAHQNESSPIKRGLFVRDRLLCQTLPQPPADLDTTPPGLDPTLTTRERFARHTESDTCRDCHKFIDGVGFGLEGFDGVGARRTEEHGLPVDESGEVRGLEGLAEDTLEPFDGPRALAALVSQSEAASQCLATQYFRFAGGRKERSADRCSVEALGDAFRESGQSLHQLLIDVTQLDSFTTRQDETP